MEFKGSVHGLPIDENGKTPNTEDNAVALRDSIVNIPNRKNIKWFDNGMYQGGTITNKNDLRLKVKLIQAFAVNQQQKIFDLEEFFNQVSFPNSYMIQIKKSIIQLLNELVDNQIIQTELEIIPKKEKTNIYQ